MANLDLKNQALMKTVLGGLVGLSMLAVFFFTHFLPFGFPNRNAQLASLKADYEKKSTDLARARAAVADLPRFESEYELLHDRWATASELLPTDRQMAMLLRKISLAGQQTGVAFLMFKPQAATDAGHYTELPLEITVSGGYHQVGAFLAEIANLQRIVTVSKLKLSTNPKAEGLSTTLATLTASSYSLSASAASPAPSAPADAPKKEKDADGNEKS